MYRSILALAASAAITASTASAGPAKYIFYFIGDGMGPNHIALTEYYYGTLADSTGIQPLGFTQWPVATLASTYSTSSRVTDSAASGTALATGTKTYNGSIGIAPDKTTPLKSIACRAKEAGKRVGIASSVGITHATPAAFYGHTASRSAYKELATQLAATDFDFFGGADFHWSNPSDTAGIYKYVTDRGLTVVRGAADYRRLAPGADRVVLLQPSEATAIVGATLPYAIDRKPGDMTLREITESGLDFLTRDGKADDNGFFFMVEGGNIDWDAHGNDAAAVIHEIKDFDDAISVAYDFYLAHPDETLIVVTADHETGSLNLSTGGYQLNLGVLANQRVSESEMSRVLNNLRRANNGVITWEMAEKALADNFGFFTDAIQLKDYQIDRLKAAFTKSFGDNPEVVVSEYRTDYPLSAEAKKIINEIALVGWGSGDHSATYVPVFAVGAGSEAFTSRTDNAQIARKIAAAGGFPVND